MTSGAEDSLPAGATWASVLEHYVDVHGTWPNLADALYRAMHLRGADPPGADTLVKGLRRLAKRGQQPGGQYGRWLIRSLGMPPDLASRAAWLGQYHSRFGDLPASVRRDHLRLWDRPPINESALVVWIHVGFASIALRAEDDAECARRLSAARGALGAASDAARMEVLLLTARLASDPAQVHALLDQVADLLRTRPDPAYSARLVGQRAFAMTHTEREPARFAAARQMFEDLPTDTGIPFVDYRRTAGLAYTTWRLGDVQAARELARAAAEHAADGGFIRFRAMALNLQARMVEGEASRQLRARARRLADSLEDVHLSRVSARYLPAPASGR